MSLPVELVISVMKFMDMEELLRASQACSEWRWLVQQYDRTICEPLAERQSLVYCKVEPRQTTDPKRNGECDVLPWFGPWFNACFEHWLMNKSMDSPTPIILDSNTEILKPWIEEFPPEFGYMYAAAHRSASLLGHFDERGKLYTQPFASSPDIVVIDPNHQDVIKCYREAVHIAAREYPRGDGTSLAIVKAPDEEESTEYTMPSTAITGQSLVIYNMVITINPIDEMQSRVIGSTPKGVLFSGEFEMQPESVFMYGKTFILEGQGKDTISMIQTLPRVEKLGAKKLGLPNGDWNTDQICGTATHLVYYLAAKNAVLSCPIHQLLRPDTRRLVWTYIFRSFWPLTDPMLYFSNRFVSFSYIHKASRARLLLFDIYLHKVDVYEHDYRRKRLGLSLNFNLDAEEIKNAVWMINWDGVVIHFTQNYLCRAMSGRTKP